MTLNQSALNGGGVGVVGTTTFLAIFSNYATEWTLLLSFIATFALVANSVVNKRRSDRQEAREQEVHKKLMGDLTDSRPPTGEKP